MNFLLANFWTRTKKIIQIFLFQKLRLLILSFNVEHVYGPRKIDYALDELIVLCVVRNGQRYVRSFIEHYFSLGVKHIVFLDNNSTDKTALITQHYQNVTILRTHLPFKRYKLAMRHYLVQRFGKDRWSLYVDIDELFDYPLSNLLGLDSLLKYLNTKSYTAVVAHMLDLFSDKSLLSQSNDNDKSLKHTYKYYDISDIVEMDYCFPRNVISNNEIRVYFGGIRKTLFMADAVGVEGLDILTKHPLVFLDKRIKPMYLHEHDIRNARIADFTCVLFHYKFLNDFPERVLEAVKKENYGNKSTQYKKYYKVLKKQPDIQIKQTTSLTINSVNDLIDNGFLVMSEAYENWVKEYN